MDLLDAAGLTADPMDVNTVEAALRRLRRQLLDQGGTDDNLLRVTVREGAIARLKGAGINSPAKMVDAALHVPKTVE